MPKTKSKNGRKKISAKELKKQLKAEEELQRKYADSDNPLIQSALAARREHLRMYGRFFSQEEIDEIFENGYDPQDYAVKNMHIS